MTLITLLTFLAPPLAAALLLLRRLQQRQYITLPHAPRLSDIMPQDVEVKEDSL